MTTIKIKPYEEIWDHIVSHAAQWHMFPINNKFMLCVPSDLVNAHQSTRQHMPPLLYDAILEGNDLKNAAYASFGAETDELSLYTINDPIVIGADETYLVLGLLPTVMTDNTLYQFLPF